MTDPTCLSVPVVFEGARAADSYDILIGRDLLAQAGGRIAPLLARPRTAILTDETVAQHHLPGLIASLDAAGITHDTIALPPGEATKSLSRLETVCERLTELGIERGDTILAFGGGVVGDLAGFAAAVLHRGMGFIQIPTTLLAQVDSAVGGKTGVNLRTGKNLVGAFHQPRLVIADTDVLSTLSDREFRAGYAEVVKYAAIDDAPFFDWLEASLDRLMARAPDALAHAVAHCCRAKARIVAEDEREKGVRALLNLGHTFGHALEAIAGYDGRVLHGEGVAVGMGLAMALSQDLGYCSAEVRARLEAHLRRAGLPVRMGDLPVTFGPDAVMAAMERDKKVADGRLTFILARGLGKSFITRDVDRERVRALIERESAPST